MNNKIMLITYPDSLGRNIDELHTILRKWFPGAIGAIHLLPFFPSSGDRGFAPLRYDLVDSQFGSWKDFESLAEDYEVMVDYMINHVSAKSEYYQDFLRNKDRSDYAGLFISYSSFFGGGEPRQEELDLIYKRKPKAPYVVAQFPDGHEEKMWSTFSDEQIDLDTNSAVGRRFLEQNLLGLARHKARAIRLDAFAYATKKAGTNCFFVEPEVWELLSRCKGTLEPYGVSVLPEIHEHFSIQQKLAERGYLVYDFALPMLLLHAIYFKRADYLFHWFAVCPRRQYTTLDTHDGIGVVDVKGLLPDADIEATKEHLFAHGANVKRVYNTEAYNNLDIYQVNCTYYSALGDDDEAYLLARAVQFFAPGTPQVYYVGLLAGRNDLELLEATKEGRNINRHYYSSDEVARELERPVLRELLKLMRLRNSHPAFDGTFSQDIPEKGVLRLRWDNGGASITLDADFNTTSYRISEG